MAQHALTLWPLPGGSGAYLEALGAILELTEAGPADDEWLAAVRQRFPSVSSDKAARSYRQVVKNLGFLKMKQGRVVLTPAGREFRRSPHPRLVARALRRHISGVDEIMASLQREPKTIGLLYRELADAGLVQWSTDKQVRYRLRWLEEAGIVTRTGRARPLYSISR